MGETEAQTKLTVYARGRGDKKRKGTAEGRTGGGGEWGGRETQRVIKK